MKRLALALLLISTSALAQQPSPEIQAMGQKLMQEINASIQCNANIITIQQEFKKLQTELKQLKDKYEPKKEEKK